MKRVWTKREIQQLVMMTLEGVGPHELARRLRMATKTVRNMQLELGLISENDIRHRHTAQEFEIVREHYEHTPTAELARRMGKTVSAVYNMGHKLGLRKTAECMALPEVCGRGRRMAPESVAAQFKPGIVPHNKGKRMPGFAPGRMASTQFKKGQSTNKMPLGATRLIDGYLYRKTSEIPNVPHTRNWRLEHYLIWEKDNGRVPVGHALVFKDGNRAHVELDNLELITRAELARRNTIHNLPEDLKEVIRLNASIKRRIRKIDDKKQDEGSEGSPLRDARSA